MTSAVAEDLVMYTMIDSINVDPVWNQFSDLHELYENHIINASCDDDMISLFYNIKTSCKYFTPQQFNYMSKKYVDKNISLFCINCQSLNSHWDDLNHLLCGLSNESFSFDVIGITEIFPIYNYINYDIDGHQPLLYNA